MGFVLWLLLALAWVAMLALAVSAYLRMTPEERADLDSERNPGDW